jgi:hypothetical protein
MSSKYELPRSITLLGGQVLEHHWSYIQGIGPSWEFMKDCARRQKAKIRKIQVLPRSLRGKRDLRGLPYQPGDWIFCSIPQNKLYKAELNGRDFTYLPL